MNRTVQGNLLVKTTSIQIGAAASFEHHPIRMMVHIVMGSESERQGQDNRGLGSLARVLARIERIGGFPGVSAIMEATGMKAHHPRLASAVD